MKIVKHYWFIAIALIMKKEDLIFQDYTVRLGGAKWDLRTHTENGFTVILHSPQVLSRIMV